MRPGLDRQPCSESRNLVAGDGNGALHETGADTACLRHFVVGDLLGECRIARGRAAATGCLGRRP